MTVKILRLQKELDELEDRRIFLLLFYREHVGRLAGRLRDQESHKRIMRKKRKKNRHNEFNLSIDQVSQRLSEFIQRAEDETRCNNICKSMYFCDLKKGHRGGHSEGPGLLGPW